VIVIKESICITVSVFPTLGGVGSMIPEYWKVFSKKYSVHFLSYPIFEAKQFNLHKISKKKIPSFIFPLCYLYTIVGLFQLFRLHKKYKFKAIIPQEGSYTALYCGIFGKITGVKVILMDFGHSVNIHNDEFWFNEGVKQNRFYQIHPLIYYSHTFFYRLSTKAIIRIAVNLMDCVMVIGVDLDELYKLRLKVPEKKIRYYELGIDEKKFFLPSQEILNETKKKFGIDKDSTIISWAGRLGHEKGIDYFLKAIERILIETTNVSVLIAGKGDMEETILDFIKKNSLSEKIKLVGLIPLDDMPAFLGISDIFLYTATQGGTMSSGVLQAMSCECAVIATNHPRSHAKLLNGKNGIVIPPHDADQIYQNTKFLLDHPVTLKEMKKEARNYILKYHSSESLQHYLDFI
jgi:glycosyltransferase involved in cell wall biosynthesis